MVEKKNDHNIIEKITFFAGALILLSLISFLVYQLVQQKGAPPDLKIMTTYEPSMDYYGFRIEVENIGQQTAEATNLKLSLYQDGHSVEEGTVGIQYVPVKSKETAWIIFHKKRKPGDSLVVSSVTYVKP